MISLSKRAKRKRQPEIIIYLSHYIRVQLGIMCRKKHWMRRYWSNKRNGGSEGIGRWSRNIIEWRRQLCKNWIESVSTVYNTTEIFNRNSLTRKTHGATKWPNRRWRTNKGGSIVKRGPYKAPRKTSLWLHMSFSITIETSIGVPIVISTVMIPPTTVIMVVRTISSWMGATTAPSERISLLLWVIITTVSLGLGYKRPSWSIVPVSTPLCMVSMGVIMRHFPNRTLRRRLRYTTIGRQASDHSPSAASTATKPFKRFLASRYAVV